jgi:LysM repeat protein
LKSQQDLIANLKEAPGLSKDSLFYRTLNSINDSIETANKKIKDIEFNFISEFFTNETELMAEEVEKNFRERATIILKAENVSQADIDKFVERIISNPDGNSMTTKDIGLNISERRAKLIVNAAKEFYFKRLGRQQIDEYLRGERGDLGYFTNWITPYANMDDPLAGGFVKFIKTKMADALTKSQNQADEITVKLLPLLNAVGYNPAKTNQLGDMLLFTDKVGFTNNQGVFEEKDVLTFINKFKNYRSDKARLQNEFDKAKSSKDPIKMKEAYEAIQDFDEKYMHRKYTKEFYDIQKIWKTGAKVKNPFTGEEITIGPKVAFDAFLERQQGLDKMSTLKNVHFLELEDLYELGDSEEQARLEYNRLFDIYGLDGKPKTGEELERVLLRKRHRELSRGMYDYDIDTDRIQKDLDNFSSQLIARGIDPDAEPKEGETQNLYQKEIERFFRKNLKTAYTSDYYRTRQQIFDDIRKITEKAGVKSQVAVDLSELYKERYRLANSTADNNGQPNGINFTPEQIDLLRDIEEQIVKLEESFDKKTGLSQEETQRLKTYIQKSANKVELTPEEQKDYAYLYQVKNDMSLTPLELATLRSKFNELAELSTKQATEYYIEAFNYAIRNLGLPEITADNADEWINSDNLTQAMAASKDFTQWFTRNHYDKMVYDPVFGKKMAKNYRLNVWTISKPTSEASYQKTTLVDPITKQPINLDGIPSGKYTKSKIKDSFMTIPRGENWDKYIGTVIDNRGNFLPRDYKPGDANSAFDKKYINEKYADMEKSNSAEFLLLKAVTESMLKVQEGKALNSRLYLDMPRFRKRSNLEYVQSGETQKNIGEKLNSFKDLWSTWFGKAPDDVEYGYNFDEGSTLVSTDLEGNAKTRVPVRGTYNLDKDLVSKDVLRGMYEYLLSLNEQEILMENEPIAKALSSVLEENPVKNLSEIDKDEFRLTGKKKFLNQKGNNRKAAIDYLIGKTFYGQRNSEFEKQHPGMTKFIQGMFRRSSRAFIAFDPQSAIKNRWGMLYQNMIYAAGGKNVSISSLAKGKLKAKESAMYWVFKDAYAKGMKTQDIQLIERFDPSLRTEQDFGKSSSRSIAKDLSDMTYMFDFRRTMEFEASMELFWGVMYNKYVDQVQPDGSVKSISYADAWTTDSDGVLQLKEGIDPNFGFREIKHAYTQGETLSEIAKKYNITEEQLKKRSGIDSVSELTPGQEITVGNATEFNRMKLLIQGINKKATGTMDRFDTPHAEKYLFYRAFTFYKRFATGMFLDKYQFDTTKGNRGGFVYNWDSMTLEKGYYPAVFQNIYRLTTSLMKDWALMTDSEKVAMRKVITEGLLLFLISMVVGSWYFGYDPEDEDRFDKIKARNESWDGYFGNHLLYLLMMTKVENESFVPVVGFKDWKNYFGNTTIATTNTVDVYLKIMDDLWQIPMGNPDAIYKQDVGPYSWQKKGRYKLWNHIGSMYGLKGKNRDAMWAIKKYETFENLDK